MLSVKTSQSLVDDTDLEDNTSLPLETVTPQNINSYLSDDQDTQEQNEFQEPLLQDPLPEEDVQFSGYGDTDKLNIAKELEFCVSLQYLTKKGIMVGTRIVEPYALYTADSGNLLLVCWDRTVNNIRSFVVGPSISENGGWFGIIKGSVKILQGNNYSFKKDKFVFRP